MQGEPGCPEDRAVRTWEEAQEVVAGLGPSKVWWARQQGDGGGPGRQEGTWGPARCDRWMGSWAVKGSGTQEGFGCPGEEGLLRGWGEAQDFVVGLGPSKVRWGVASTAVKGSVRGWEESVDWL